MFFLALKIIIGILVEYAKACKFGGGRGQLFVTLFAIFFGGFFFVVVPLNFILGTSYSLEIVNYDNFYFIISSLFKIFSFSCFALVLIIGWLNTKTKAKKIYYFKPFYFVIIIVALLFICIVAFAAEAFLYVLPVIDGACGDGVIFNTFKLHKLVAITDSHPFYLEINQYLQPKGGERGFYNFDVLPSNTKYIGEYNFYVSDDVDLLIDRIEEEKRLAHLMDEKLRFYDRVLNITIAVAGSIDVLLILIILKQLSLW